MELHQILFGGSILLIRHYWIESILQYSGLIDSISYLNEMRVVFIWSVMIILCPFIRLLIVSMSMSKITFPRQRFYSNFIGIFFQYFLVDWHKTVMPFEILILNKWETLKIRQISDYDGLCVQVNSIIVIKVLISWLILDSVV